MAETETNDDLTTRQAVGLLLAILVIAAGLRVVGLGDRTMGHIEAYVPGIEFPEGISAPHPRITLWETLKGSFEEPHPPAWYLLNWPWTKAFGTELFWLRLPSVLAGLLGVALIYRVAADWFDRRTAVASALVLAVHGYHVFWSQIARPYALSPTLALLATALLWRALGAAPTRRWRIGYLATTLVGLANSYYFWPLYGAQMLWVMFGTWGRRPDWRSLLRWQLAVLILATPIVALALFQSRESYLEQTFVGVLQSLGREWAGLGYLFRTYGDPRVAPPVGPAVLWTLVGATAALALLGIAARKRAAPSTDAATDEGPSGVLVALAALIAVAGILGGAWYVHQTGRYEGKGVPMAWVAVAPLALGAFSLLERRFGLISTLPHRLIGRGPSVSLATWSALVPIGLVALACWKSPLYAPRHVLTFVPFLLILVCGGLVRLLGIGRTWVQIVLGWPATLFVLAMLGIGFVYQAERPSSPKLDYGAAAAAWLPEVREGDLVFMPRHWVNTPILYYMRYGRYRYVWQDFDAARRERPGARVWHVSYEGVPDSAPLRRAIDGLQLVTLIALPGIRIELLTP